MRIEYRKRLQLRCSHFTVVISDCTIPPVVEFEEQLVRFHY